uniref:F-box domain-containing protein n=1 Tax=Ditylenchus dipsaci TaxID=166011 RepID=A0A915CYW8_9BILA
MPVTNQENLLNVLPFLSRSELEYISIISQLSNQLVDKCFSNTPYRYFSHIDVSQSTTYIRSPHAFPPSVPTLDNCIEDHEHCAHIPNQDLFPLLKNKTIRVGYSVLFINPLHLSSEDQAVLLNINNIWKESVLALHLNCCTNNYFDQQCFEKIFEHPEIYKCSHLMIDMGLPIVPTRFHLAKFKFLYECDVIELTNFVNFLKVEDAVDFVHHVPAERANQLQIILSFNKYKHDENEQIFRKLLETLKEVFLLNYKSLFFCKYGFN